MYDSNAMDTGCWMFKAEWMPGTAGVRNSKDQVPNNKKILNSNFQNTKPLLFWLFGHWNLKLIWNLVFGAWNFI